MSRRKDRERLLSQKRINPDYVGFRGYDREPHRAGATPMATVVCSVCGRKRNVPVGVAQEQGDRFICSSCIEERATTDDTPDTVAAPKTTTPPESEAASKQEP